MSRRLRFWAYVTASLVALAWPFVWDFVFQWRLGRLVRSASGTAQQQAEELFALFDSGLWGSHFLALDWPFRLACVVFVARAFLLLRCHRHVPGHCRRCGYNLTGLPEPRCPECGEAFEARADAP